MIIWGVWLVHVCIIAFVAFRHEPWQDETHAWRLAIDSPDLGALFANSRYEGHPLLWYVLLHALGKLSREWWLVAAFHTVIASATTWLILRCAPMPLWQRVAVVFGYYFAYEYAIIVRSYSLGVLLAVAACCAWTGPRRRPWIAGIVLVVLANTSVMGLIVAGAAAVGFFVDWAYPDDHLPQPTRGRIALLATALCATALLVASEVSLQVTSPSDLSYKGDGALSGSWSAWALSSALAMPAKAFLPIAVDYPAAQRWQLGLVFPTSRRQWAAADLLAGATLVLALLTCMRRRSGIATLVAGSGVLVAFAFFVLQGGPRHHGHLVLIWLIALWLAAAGEARTSWWPAMSARAARLAPAAFVILHVPLVAASVQYWFGDIQLQFSDATRTAQTLQTAAAPNTPIVAATPADGMAVAALVDAPVYSAMEGRVATYATWGFLAPELRDKLDGQELEAAAIERAVRLMLTTSCQTLLLKSPAHPLPESLTATSTLVYRTRGVTITSERFEIWRVVSPTGAGRSC